MKNEFTLSDINECSSNPCKNDGACVDLVNGYKCTCVAGYNGDDCDQSKTMSFKIRLWMCAIYLVSTSIVLINYKHFVDESI
jgi:hypothetical protein